MDSNLLLLEGAKLAIQSYFNYMRLAGKTPEEMEEVFQKERETFLKNNPKDLPEV